MLGHQPGQSNGTGYLYCDNLLFGIESLGRESQLISANYNLLNFPFPDEQGASQSPLHVFDKAIRTQNIKCPDKKHGRQ